MYRIQLGLFLILVTFLCVAGNKWNVTLPDGQIRFQGELIAEACTVHTGNLQQIVSMGSVSTNRFKEVGDDTNPVPFSLHLMDCDTNVSRQVSIVFRGIADSKNPNVLAINKVEAAAFNIGIVLFDNYGQVIPINSDNSEVHSWKPLMDGSHILTLVAKYRATGNSVIGGVVNSQAWFSITYQ